MIFRKKLILFFSLICQLLMLLSFVSCGQPGSSVDNILGPKKEEVGNPAISFSPSPYSFGILQANLGSATQIVSIRNESNRIVYLTSMSGTNLNFTILSTTCLINGSPFLPGDSCSVTVNFSPKVSGLLTMGLSFLYGTSAGEGNLTASGSLSGTGITPLVFPGIDSVDQIKCSSARVNWTNVAGASNYLVFNGSSLLGTALSGTSSTVITGLTPGATYNLKVQATDALGIITANTSTQSAIMNPAPIIMNQSNLNFPSNFVSQNSVMSTVNYNNLVSSNDINMSYECYYDKLPDGLVANTNNCNNLHGVASFSSSTGELNWTPNHTALGPYEIKVVARYFNECELNNIFIVDVRGNFSTAQLVAEWDVNFSDLTKPFVSVPLSANTWKNLAATGAALDGTLSATTWPLKWQGTGTTAQPFRLGFDSVSQDLVNFGAGLNGYTDLTIGTWIKTSTPTSPNQVIFGNGGGTASGFAVRQSVDAGKLEFVVGAVDAMSGYQSILSSLNPVAYWKLDETSGTAISDSAGSADGTATGVSLNETGAVSTSHTSVLFSGASSYINIPDTAALNITTGGLSISAWIYPTTTAGYRAILGKGNGGGGVYAYLFALDSGTLFPSLYMSTPNALWSNRATTPVVLNSWNHVAVTYNPTGSKLIYYVNGVEAGNYTVSGGAVAVSPERLEIGTMINNGYSFVGKIDEVAIFNSVLDLSEVSALYSSFVSCRSATALPSGVWNFVGTVFNSATNSAQLLVNGAQVCSVTFPTGLTGAASPFVIGAKADGSSAWSGEMAHMAVYNTANATKITEMYNTTAVRFFDWPTPIAANLTFHLNASRGNGNTFLGPGCGATTWNDLSANNYIGTLTNFSACGSILGWQGIGIPTDPHRMEFLRGSAPYNVVSFPHNSAMNSIANGITIFSILKLNAYQGDYRPIVGKGNNSPNYGFLLTFPVNERKLSLYLSNDVGGNPHATWADLSTTAIPVGTWVMVAATWDNATNRIKYYLNGVLDGDYPTTPATTIGLNARPLEIGAMIDAAYSFDGAIAAVLIYDRALTLAEIQQNCIQYQPFISGLVCN
jgi:Concanavalin A-like lectin/glucanases superfamily